MTSVNRPNLLQIEGEEMQFEKQIWIIGRFIWDLVEVLLQLWQSLSIDLWLEVTKCLIWYFLLFFIGIKKTPLQQTIFLAHCKKLPFSLGIDTS